MTRLRRADVVRPARRQRRPACGALRSPAERSRSLERMARDGVSRRSVVAARIDGLRPSALEYRGLRLGRRSRRRSATYERSDTLRRAAPARLRHGARRDARASGRCRLTPASAAATRRRRSRPGSRAPAGEHAAARDVPTYGAGLPVRLTARTTPLCMLDLEHASTAASARSTRGTASRPRGGVGARRAGGCTPYHAVPGPTTRGSIARRSPDTSPARRRRARATDVRPRPRRAARRTACGHRRVPRSPHALIACARSGRRASHPSSVNGAGVRSRSRSVADAPTTKVLRRPVCDAT